MSQRQQALLVGVICLLVGLVLGAEIASHDTHFDCAGGGFVEASPDCR